MISGATKSGKTSWVRRLLNEKNHLFKEPSPTNVHYCYGAYDPQYELIEDASFHEGLPSKENILKWSADEDHLLIVIDDLMSDVINSKEIEELFTRGCHHNKISIIFVTQNLFAQGRAARNLALNTSYLVLFKNVRDKSQIKYLARQAFPENTSQFMKAYEAATNPNYGYLVLDMTPTCEEKHRIRTRMWNHQHPIVYLLNK